MNENLPRGAGRVVGCVFLSLIVFGAGGCATLPLALLGTVAGAAGSAASAGRDVYALGKLDTAEQVDFDTAVAATEQTAYELGLQSQPAKQHCERKDPTLIEFRFVDDKKARIKVRVDRRAAQLVLFRIDVGWFGSEVTAHLFLTRLRAHLPTPRPPDPTERSGPSAGGRTIRQEDSINFGAAG